MPYTVISDTRQGLDDRLRGATSLGPFTAAGLPLGTLTLEFTTPLATVTFSGALNDVRTLAEIVDEINTALGSTVVIARPRPTLPSLTGTQRFDLIVFRDAGFTIAETGTANVLFGLSDAVPTVNTGSMDPTRVVGLATGSTPGHYAVIIAPA